MADKPRVTLLVNIVAPYRVPVYDVIGQAFDLKIFTSGIEKNRGTWSRDFGDVHFQVDRAWGITIPLGRKQNGKVIDTRFIHVTPGYFWALLKTRPHAIISNEMGFRTLAAMIYGTVLGKPVWVWWGGTMHTEREVGGFKRRLRALFAKWVRNWISYGETSTEYLMSLGIARERIVQIQNCVDHRKFHAGVTPVLTDLRHRVILHVGQFIGRKGIDCLLQACARMNRTDFTLVLVGHGPEREAMEELASSLGLTNVVFVAPKKPEEMPGVYASCDILVFPTLEDVWGLVANEAILCGKPVLVSRFAGCAPEVVAAENVFDPTDIDGFAARLSSALDGAIAPAEPQRLKSFEEVGEMIVSDIRSHLSR